ncbi:hypothetical protein EYZ11_011813 [Aspergillus tanneri]|uniref:Uncharacterized protein n=1 Tax=Aspergillus tanneri TaxID=1220188 RepID=A0A4S3J3Y3_9EURO|nr:hypothetical protein EYZ11_011813 [Aspergillus tanneri]
MCLQLYLNLLYPKIGFPTPSSNHRRLLSSDADADRTPIGTSMYIADGPGLDDWSVHTQQLTFSCSTLNQATYIDTSFPSSRIIGEISGTSRYTIIDGKGLVAHYTTGMSLEGLETTDILQHYEAYVKEKVCLDTT